MPALNPHDLAVCRQRLNEGSRSFYLASKLLPRDMANAAASLYAFCRMADDAIDIHGLGVDVLRDRLNRIYRGQPADEPEDRAFASVVSEYELPRELPEALLEGFEWDIEGRRYADIGAVRQYAARVAGTVGAMMAILMDRRGDNEVSRACDLGIAMQLTNISRDVGEDARADRLYLPLDWLQQEGVDAEQWLRDPVYCPEIGSVVRRLLADADELYTSADAGILRLPRICRPSIKAARYLYAGIGDRVIENGLDSVTDRAVVSNSRKLKLLLRALGPTRLTDIEDKLAKPALAESAFLVSAVSSTGVTARQRRRLERPRWWSVRDQTLWLLDLFESLERQDQLVSEQKKLEHRSNHGRIPDNKSIRG